MATATTRIMAGLIVAAGLLAGAMAFRPHWVTGLRPQAAAARPQWTISHPDRESLIVARRIAAKAEAVALMLDGERTLFETAETFTLLNSHPPGREAFEAGRFPGRDDGERACRQVIVWAAADLSTRCPASEVAARVVRLERVLSDHLASHGGVQLGAH